MKNLASTKLNALFLLCRAERLTVSALSRATGINRTRLHRLVHLSPVALREALTVSEARKIADAFPEHPYIY